MFRVYYSDTYPVPMPEGHHFPMEKYRLLHRMLLDEGILDERQLHEAPVAARELLQLVHTDEYIDSFTHGTLEKRVVEKIGIPWSTGYVTRSYASVGGTVEAARAALQDGIAGNLDGGTHHAFGDCGEGYCAFNDVAVAIRVLQHDGLIGRAAVVDLDAHQGNGTAGIFASDDSVFTFSMHTRNIYPFPKVPSKLDVPLQEGTGDLEYNRLLEHALQRVMTFAPDMIFYVAGVDTHEADGLGRLKMTHEGMQRRDRLVLEAARECDVPVVLTMGGGYGDPITETVRAHAGTYRVAAGLFREQTTG